MKTVYPYPVLAGRVEAQVRSASIDGVPIPYSYISQQEHVVALHQVERDNWREGMLELEVTGPYDELSDGPWASQTCVAVLAEAATNTRTVTPLRRDGRQWRGEVRLQRAMHRTRATLDVSFVGTYNGVAGRTIGRNDEPWIIDLTARTPTQQREITIEEVDFRDGPVEWLRPYKDAPWILETSGDMPTVFLNSSFEGLVPLLSGARGPLERAAASLVAAQIANDVWTAMFQSALGELEVEDGTVQLPGGWREPVLRSMLPDIFPAMPLADALFEVHSRRTEGHGWSELQSQIQFAAAKRGRLPKSLTEAVRAVSRSQEGEGR